MADKPKPIGKVPPKSWQLQTASKELIANVRRLERVPAELQALDVPIAIKGAFDNFLGGLPGMALSGAFAAGQVYACTFYGAGEFLHRTNGSIQATLVGPSNKFVENATLLSPSAVASVAGVALVWQALAVATAQRFLVDISERLAAIQQRLEDIYEYMKSRERGRLKADAHELQDIYRAVMERAVGQPTSYEELRRFLDLTKSIEREAAATLEAELETFESHRKKTAQWRAGQNHPFDDKPATQVKKLQQMLKDAADAYSLACAAAYVQCLALTVAVTLGADEVWLGGRVEHVGRSLAGLPRMLQDLEKQVEAKLPQIQTIFPTWLPWVEEDDSRRRASVHLEDLSRDLRAKLDQTQSLKDQLVQVVAAVPDAARGDVELVLTTDRNGKVVSVSRIAASKATANKLPRRPAR